MHRRRTSRIVTTVLSTALAFSAANQVAYADDPIPAPQPTAQPAGGAGLPGVGGTQIITDTSVSDTCTSLGLSTLCAGHIEPDVLVNAARSIAEGCTAPTGVCSYATNAATDALALASECLNATGALGLQASLPINCDELIRSGVALAGFVLEQARSCTAAEDATCRAVFDAASMGLDRAAGCLAAALNAAGAGTTATLAGTDPGCADAVTVLRDQAMGVVGLVSGCVSGSDVTCHLAYDIANFVITGLTGCAGELVLNLTDLPAVLPASGPLACWQVVDQANQALNNLMGDIEVPTSVGGEDCSVSVAYATDPTDPRNADFLVPPCDSTLPDPDVRVSTLATPQQVQPIAGRECDETEKFVVDDKNENDTYFVIGKTPYTNVNVKKITTTITVEVNGGIDLTYTGQASGEFDIILAKVKAQVSASIAAHVGMKFSFSEQREVPPKTKQYLGYVIWRRVAIGHMEWTGTDCKVTTAKRTVKGPYEHGPMAWQKPYTGGHP